MIALKASRLVLHAIVIGLLGACAGGGGGGGGPILVSPPPPPPSPAPFPPLAPPHARGDYPAQTSSEYAANWGVAGTKASAAWEAGATGAGVVVGVIDDGIDPYHPELVGRISPASIDIVAGRDALVTSLSHGSEVASLIVGNYNGAQTVGVAFDATVLAIRADNGVDGFDYDALADAIDHARVNGADVINMSLGGPSYPTANSGFVEAVQRATEAGVIIVVSAGNDGQTAGNPNYPGFLAVDDTIANGLIMIAGATNPDGSYNLVSNPAGAAQNFYLTAPGWDIIVPDHGPPGAVPGFQSCGAAAGIAANLCEIQGTSYASPHVAGAVALLMSGFPGLTPSQVVQVLLLTADDTGALGIDSVMGHGRLNLERAFQPVGPLAVPLGGATTYASVPLGVSGSAFGDSLVTADAWQMVGFDSFGRTFAVNLANNWRMAAGPALGAQAPRLWRSERVSAVSMHIAPADDVAPDSYRLDVNRDDLQQGATRIDVAIAPGLDASFAAHGAGIMRPGEGQSHLGLSQAHTSLRFTQRLSSAMSLSLLNEGGSERVGLDRSLQERSATALQSSFASRTFGFDATFGRAIDSSGILGLSWTDTLGDTPSGETHFAGVNTYIDLDSGWRLRASAEYGVSELDQVGWLSVAEPLRTSAFGLGLEHDFASFSFAPFELEGGGVLSLRLTQPLRVEAGELSFVAPQATKYGRRSLSYEQRTIDPEPSGRELRASLGFTYSAAGQFSAFGEATYVHQPRHIADANPDAMFRFGLRVAR